MKQIPLTQGQYTLVDDTDYDWLNQWKWCVIKDRSGAFYVVRNLTIEKGKKRLIRMSRQILGLTYGDKRQADHKDHNTLDNQRSNLRICTHQQNNMNRKSFSNTSSKYKGVTWSKQAKKWIAHIQVNKKVKYLRLFDSEKDAAEAYDRAAIQEFGEFAYLNYPLEKIEKVLY